MRTAYTNCPFKRLFLTAESAKNAEFLSEKPLRPRRTRR